MVSSENNSLSRGASPSISATYIAVHNNCEINIKDNYTYAIFRPRRVYTFSQCQDKSMFKKKKSNLKAKIKAWAIED